MNSTTPGYRSIRNEKNPVRSFGPIADRTARILILGSMPGAESLRAGQYYAHPRNAFWPIMEMLLHDGSTLSYTRRVKLLKQSRIALWDVLHSCIRAGSLDVNIRREFLVPNDFSEFLERHPLITQVYFNGAKAEEYFRKHALPQLNPDRFSLQRLPSTSPAHASLTFQQKLGAWKVITGS